MEFFKKFLHFSLALFALVFLVSPAFAQTTTTNLGNAEEMNFHGVSSGASYGVYHPPGSTPSYTWYDDDKYEAGIDQTVESSQLGGKAWAKTSPYSMHGYLDGSIATNGNVYNDTLDELFFTTATGDAATLDFNFNFNFTASVIDQTIGTEKYLSDAELSVRLWADSVIVDSKKFIFRSSETMIDGKYDYFIDLFDTKKTVIQNPDGSFTYTAPDATFAMVDGLFDFSSPIVLSTDGWAGASETTGLIDSGTYLPIMISIDAEDSSGNLIFDYSNSLDINGDNPYDAFDEQGNELPPAAFALASSENFEKPGAGTVPEPTTLILFGSGLVGLAVRRRK